MEYVQYEKFNRLCHLFFFVPGSVFKQKNDSENLYLVMTNLANTKASILQHVSLLIVILLLIFLEIETSQQRISLHAVHRDAVCESASAEIQKDSGHIPVF